MLIIKTHFFDKIEKHVVEAGFLNLTILLYLFRSIIPILKYPFILFFIGLIAYFGLTYNKKIAQSLIAYIRNFYIILILTLLLILAFIFSEKIYLDVFKDVVNVVVILSLFFLLSLIVSTKHEFHNYIDNLIYQVLIFGILISFLRLIDLFGIYSYLSVSHFDDIISASNQNPLYIDSNFALLPSFFGIVGLFYFSVKKDSNFQRIIFGFSFTILILNIILAGSRRGLIALSILYSILFFSQLVIYFYKGNFPVRINRSAFIQFSIVLLSIFMVLIYFFFFTSYRVKNQTLEFIGTKNLLITKTRVSMNIYKYTTAIKPQISYKELYDRMWTSGFDPADPESGWGSRIHTTIFPLTGKNVEIVPKKAMGYKMDHTCDVSYYPSNETSESYSLIVNMKVATGDTVKGSVFCYVSDSAQVDVVAYTAGYSAVKGGIVSGNYVDSYNLDNKGCWQKLEINFQCEDGEVPLFLTFYKSGIKDFSQLNGYVIFAYPQYEKISLSDTSISGLINFNRISTVNSENLLHTDNSGISLSCPIYPEEIIPMQKVTDIIFFRNPARSENSLYETEVYTLESRFQLSSFVFSSSGKIPHIDSIKKDSDPIRNMAKRLIEEDSTYYPYKSKIELDTISNNFIGSRILRWKFALKLFVVEYNWRKKLFGNGFNFLNWYGYYFNNDKSRIDYPHNPFLSVLLYSGIIGLMVYLIFIYNVIYYCIKYFQELRIIIIFLCITAFFSFFSAGNPFDPPVMGFFVILPYFIHHIHKKDVSDADDSSKSKNKE